MILHEKIAAQLPEWRERVKKLIKEHGDVVVDQVTVGQVYGGMRDAKVMVTDISYVDPAEGIRFRGYSIPEVLSKLPKPDGSTSLTTSGAEMPYVGGLYYLLRWAKSRPKSRPAPSRRNGAGAAPSHSTSTRRCAPCPRKPTR